MDLRCSHAWEKMREKNGYFLPHPTPPYDPTSSDRSAASKQVAHIEASATVGEAIGARTCPLTRWARIVTSPSITRLARILPETYGKAAQLQSSLLLAPVAAQKS